MAKAPNFDDKDSFESWLKSFDDETALAYAKMLSGRVALRVVPFLGFAWTKDLPLENVRNFTLQSCRTFFFAAAARKFLRDGIDSVVNAAADASEITWKLEMFGETAIFAADANALASSTSIVSATLSLDSAILSGGLSLGHFDPKDIWASVREDAQKFLDGMDVKAVGAQPLWLGKKPDWFTTELNAFRQHLKQDGPHWDFWLDWYAAKVAGEPMDRLGIQGEDFVGQKLAEQDGAFWDRGPEAVSADIEAWIEEWAGEKKGGESNSDALPQNPVGAQFITNADGQVDVVSLPPEDRLLDTPQNREEFDDLRDIANEVFEQGQMLGPVERPLSSFIELLDNDLNALSARQLWKAGMKMRRLLKMHEAVADDPDYNPNKLDKACVVAFTDFINQLNIYFSADPILRERDNSRISPQDRLSNAEQDAIIMPALEEVFEGVDWATEAAVEEVQPLDDALPEGVHADQINNEKSVSRQNFIASLLTWVRQNVPKPIQWTGGVIVGGITFDGLKSAFSAMGGHAPAVFDFVARHGVALKAYVIKTFNNPTFAGFLEQIMNLMV